MEKGFFGPRRSIKGIIEFSILSVFFVQTLYSTLTVQTLSNDTKDLQWNSPKDACIILSTRLQGESLKNAVCVMEAQGNEIAILCSNKGLK